MPARLIQLSDFHLLDSPEGELRGVPTAACLKDVIDLLKTEYWDADNFILSGDLAAYGDEGAYRQVQKLWGDDFLRCLAIPGNHDLTAVMRDCLSELKLSQAGPITFSQSVAGWRLIGLDTHQDDVVAGAIADEQLDWFESELQQNSQQSTLLFMHHPPISIESRGLDAIMLQQPERLISIVRQSPQIRGVFCGHVHQEFAGSIAGTPVYTAPATAIQFVPGTEEIEFHDIPAGFRVIELSDNGFETHVVRLPELKYRAEPRS
jgi:Icc protein